MRQQVIEPSLNFECSSCTFCCDQPWRTVIKADKATALDQVDWAAEFPALEGRELYRTVRIGKETVYELGKGDGTRCVFLDSDNLCIIHKKLGHDAKPHMCKQFPLFPATAWDADYISANFGCPSIQRRLGPPTAKNADAITQMLKLGTTPVKPDAPIPLTPTRLIPQSAARALRELLSTVFRDSGDVTLTQQFATALATLDKAIATPPDELESRIDSDDFAEEADPEQSEPYATACVAPMPSRFLFAATLFPDALPPDATGDMGFLKRMILVPRECPIAS